MAGLVTLALGALLTIGGAWLAYTSYKRRRQRQLMESTETSTIRSITDGPVEIVGTTKPSDEGGVRAPFSEDTCLVAEWRIEEWEESGKHSSWKTVGSGVVGAPFLVDDGTGEVLVRPKPGATVDIDTAAEAQISVPGPEDPPEPIREFLALSGTPGPSNQALIKALDWGNQVGDRRYDQHLIRPGEEVYVHGTAVKRDGSENVWGGGPETLEIRAVTSDDDVEEAGMFLVSDHTQEELVSDRRYAGVRLAFGAVLLVAGLLFLVIGIVNTLMF